MKRTGLLLLLILAITACKKTPVVETGDLLLTIEYDGTAEENVEVWLFDSPAAFDKFEYLDYQLSDENGEVFFGNLLPGMYYYEAEITKPVSFHLYASDSTEVVANIQKNKRLILSIDK